MLLRFFVKNFRSIRDRQELTLVASSLRDLEQSKMHIEAIGVDALRVAAMYGANASGKTSVIRALHYMASAVINSQRTWPPSGPIPVEPFLLDSVSAATPSTFEVDLVIDGTRYNYGFSLDSLRVIEEWLLAFPRGRKQVWFRRRAEQDDGFRFGKYLLGENRSIQSLTRPNSLFLSAAAQNGHQQLLPIFEWFSKRLSVVSPTYRDAFRLSAVRMCDTDDGRERLLRFLESADLGIVGIDAKEREIPEKLQTAFRVFLKSITDAEPPTDANTIPDIHLRHQSSDGAAIALEFENESDGTKALFALAAPVSSALSTGGVLCIDELDSSLHPVLALQVVQAFVDPASNTSGAQLIFSTHDTNLLDADLLRRDQIWFTEKDRSGATHLYPLSDFRPRRGENLQRGYLQGRYGAIPLPSRLVSSDG